MEDYADIFLFEKMNEIYDNKISFMIESLDNQLRINMLEAQYKVVTENGTREDFEYLYMEAKKEVKEKKKGIFQSIIDWLKRIKEKISDFFTKKKIDSNIKKLPNSFKVDKSYEKKFNLFKKFFDWLKRPIEYFKKREYDKMAGDLMIKGVEIVAAADAVVLLNTIVTFSKSKFKTQSDWIMNTFKTNCDFLIKIANSDDASLPVKLLRKLISIINSMVSQAMKWVLDISYGIWDVEKEVLAQHAEDNRQYRQYASYRRKVDRYNQRYQNEKRVKKQASDALINGMVGVIHDIRK